MPSPGRMEDGSVGGGGRWGSRAAGEVLQNPRTRLPGVGVLRVSWVRLGFPCPSSGGCKGKCRSPASCLGWGRRRSVGEFPYPAAPLALGSSVRGPAWGGQVCGRGKVGGGMVGGGWHRITAPGKGARDQYIHSPFPIPGPHLSPELGFHSPRTEKKKSRGGGEEGPGVGCEAPELEARRGEKAPSAEGRASPICSASSTEIP